MGSLARPYPFCPTAPQTKRALEQLRVLSVFLLGGFRPSVATNMQERYITGLKEQDQQVFSDLYDAYGGALYGLALRIVQSHELAEQVLQDTFLKIWRHGASFDPAKGRLYTWMSSIARNTAIEATRLADFQRRKQMDSPDQLIQRPGDMGVTVDHIGVRETLDKLDEKYRQLIELVYFQGYTQEEAAETMGIPLGTVKTRLRAAIGELRKFFGDVNATLLVCFLSNIL